MSEIKDRATDKIISILHQYIIRNLDETITISEGWITGLILSIPELAIVDREAELPVTYFVELTKLAYQKAQQDMLKAGWVKEVK